jgi:hypothetical protein
LLSHLILVTSRFDSSKACAKMNNKNYPFFLAKLANLLSSIVAYFHIHILKADVDCL